MSPPQREISSEARLFPEDELGHESLAHDVELQLDLAVVDFGEEFPGVIIDGEQDLVAVDFVPSSDLERSERPLPVAIDCDSQREGEALVIEQPDLAVD